ncbi:MAG: FHA domain-containing protein [Planctomycetes bacterium]|nr:FHA domain-containing protein [Planctomycetota bacterium]
MEPITLGLALVGVLGSAIWQVVADAAGNKVLDHVKHAFLKKFLRNDDIQRVLREAYVTALSMIEKEYFKQMGAALGKEERKAIELALKALKEKAEVYFPRDPSFSEQVDHQAPAFLSPGPSAREVADAVLRQVGPVPESFREMLEVSFADAFVFCFKELGLKRDEKVRSVIYYEMLADLRGSAKVTEDGVRLLVDGFQRLDGDRRVRERFETTALEALGGIDRGIARIEEQVRHIAAAVEQPSATAEVKGVLHVYGDAGQELSRHPIHSSALTIGRDPTNAIQLPHSSVSGRHAELAAQGIHFVIRDLGSTNGTFVGGARVRSKPIGFGDRVRIGPYEISILEPKPAEDLLYPPTIPLSGAPGPQ